MTDPRTEQRLAAAMALAAEVDAAGSSDAMRGPVSTLGHEWRDFARRTMAADPALFAASDEALPSHPDDGHKHRYSCLRCGVDAPLPAASDEALREGDERCGLVEYSKAADGYIPCRVIGPHVVHDFALPSPDRDRLAALGEAVERLGSRRAFRIQYMPDYGNAVPWSVTIYPDGLTFKAPTLPEAIAAALGAESTGTGK